MKADIIIGVLASVALHGGFFFGGELFAKAEKIIEQKEEVKLVELAQMPEVPPDETPPELDTGPKESIEDFKPQSNDMPVAVVTSSFVQQMQPPPKIDSKGQMRITAAAPTKIDAAKAVFNISDLDQKPEARFQAPPVYPFEMKKNRIMGRVVVQFIVDASGLVRDAVAISSTHREFENAAVVCVSKWKFSPGKKGGAAVNTRMEVPIAFKLSAE